MVTLVNKLLYPMDLKRYMVLSFATLWTLVLIITLIVSIIHNVHYQDSASQFHLEWEVRYLEQNLVDANKIILKQEQEIKVLKCPWYFCIDG